MAKSKNIAITPPPAPVWKYELYLKESSKTPSSSGETQSWKAAHDGLLAAVAARWSCGDLTAYSSGRIIRPDGIVLYERLAPTWALDEKTL